MLMVGWESVLLQRVCLLHCIFLLQPILCCVGFEKPSAIQQRGIVPFCKGLDVIQQAQFMRALGDQLGVKVHACVGGTSVREDQKDFQPVVCMLLLVNLVVCLTCCVGCPSALITSRCLFFDEADEMLSRGFKDQVNSSILFLLSLYLIMVPVFFASKVQR